MENLEINENDTSLDTTKLPNSRSTFIRTIAGILTTMTLFSGSIMSYFQIRDLVQNSSTRISKNYDDEELNKIVELPEVYRKQLVAYCGKSEDAQIKMGDLKYLTGNIIIEATDSSSLEFLNYCESIDYLTIYSKTQDTNIYKGIKELKGVKHLNLQQKSLSGEITLEYGQPTVDSDNFQFLKNSKDLESLRILGYCIEPGFIESMTNLKNFYVSISSNYDIDFSKLTFLEKLKINDDNPYTIAKDFTSQDYQTLIDSGVEVAFANEGDLELFLSANEKLDSIVASLEVTKDSTDQEKLNSILIYILDNLSYDDQVAENTELGKPDYDLVRSFYEKGLLYGALEKDTAICGNYAALFEALANRLDLPAYYAIGGKHAWNIVEVEGELYYVDSTALDTDCSLTSYTEEEIVDGVITEKDFWRIMSPQKAIEKGLTEGMNWYLEAPSDLAESHPAINIPSYININPTSNVEVTDELPESKLNKVENSEPIKLDGKSYTIQIEDRSWNVGGAVVLGLLTGMGSAIAINNKKEKQQELTEMFENTTDQKANQSIAKQK